MNDLETHVLDMIGEDSTTPDVFTDDSTGMAQIRDSLNDAIEEITMLTGSVKRKYYLPLEDGMNFYQLSFNRGNLAWITDVWMGTVKRRLHQKDFTWLAMNYPNWQEDNGPPVHYGQFGNDYFWVHPTPSADTIVLEIDTVVVPARYTLDDQRVSLRDNFKWAAVHYAVGEYWASRGDAKTAVDHHMRYLEKTKVIAIYPEAHERIWTFKTDKT